MNYLTEDSVWTWPHADTPCDACGVTITAGDAATRTPDGDVLCRHCTW